MKISSRLPGAPAGDVMNFVSLFSGIGGFDVGFERSGMSCISQVENNPDCAKVLSRHWPNIGRHSNIEDFNGQTADLICGGFPCQDLSVAGRRAGLAGKRSGLWFEFLRILQVSKPKWVVIENVPGLLSSNGGNDFAVILRGLVECGYGVCWRVLDAQYFGLAQRRKRVFIVGSLGSGMCAQVLFESEGLYRNTPPSRKAGQRASRALANGTGSSGYRFDPNGEEFVTNAFNGYTGGPDDNDAQGRHLVAGPVTTKPYADNESQETRLVAALPADHNIGSRRDQESMLITHSLRSEGADASEDGTGRGTPLVAYTLHGSDKTVRTGSETEVAGSVRTRAPGSIENSSTTVVAQPLRSNRWGGSDSHGDEGNSVVDFTVSEHSNGHAWERDIAPTLDQTNGTMQNQQYGVRLPTGVRRLTPRECERLQGFDDDWTRYDADGKEISDSARYRMLGNAVAVPVAEWIGKKIVAIAEVREAVLVKHSCP